MSIQSANHSYISDRHYAVHHIQTI